VKYLHPLGIGLIAKKNKSLKILVPGAGLGHEVIYGFKNGFKNIFYMDYARDAIKEFKKKCPYFPKDQILSGDFFKLNNKNRFDVIVEQTFFCAQTPIKRVEYVKKIHQLLMDNGKLVGLLFDINFDNTGPPFGGGIKEYKSLFKEKFEFLEFKTSSLSIKERKNIEVWIDLKKK
jgi:thiopurine S-methyltransferase